jgi:uncharacterized protein (TIGR00297 family)
VIQPPPWVAGLLLAIVVAFVALRARALSTSGAGAAVVAGTVAVGAGWSWGFVLIAYFASSTLLSRFRAAEKEGRTGGRVEKHGPRDAAQVAANGGTFVAAAIGYWIHPHVLWQAVGAGALAASASDTWATELGTLSRQTPRSILGWTSVAPGTSGGVTAQGFVAGAAGAAFIALVTSLARWPMAATISAAIGGILGCLLDSVLGASVQARYWCATCDAATEQRLHRCGARTQHVGGYAWLDNDGVNAAATLGGALLGSAASHYYF